MKGVSDTEADILRDDEQGATGPTEKAEGKNVSEKRKREKRQKMMGQ
ncbi:hypothetical protein [Paenibacillus thiaminolyticus]|nr:hypothetical protein [Paenibacillus thiaminolyticus]